MIHFKEFNASDTEILGISRDSIKSHENFKAKFEFPFDLLSDHEELACKLFDVIKMKKCTAKKFVESNAVHLSLIKKVY